MLPSSPDQRRLGRPGVVKLTRNNRDALVDQAWSNLMHQWIWWVVFGNLVKRVRKEEQSWITNASPIKLDKNRCNFLVWAPVNTWKGCQHVDKRFTLCQLYYVLLTICQLYFPSLGHADASLPLLPQVVHVPQKRGEASFFAKIDGLRYSSVHRSSPLLFSTVAYSFLA